MTPARFLGVAAVLWTLSPASAQVVFTRWDFNAPGLSPTNPAPSLSNNGTGSATMVGGVTPDTAGAFLSDQGASDAGTGTAWAMTNFPNQGTASGTAGAEFQADATGYSNITFECDLRASTTFSDFVGVQYSLDHGSTWTFFATSPYQVPGNTGTTAVVWNNNIGSGFAGQPLFALPATANGLADVRTRIVTVFSPALGNAYAPNSPINGAGVPLSYLPTGWMRLDVVEFKGTAAPSGPPSISAAASSVTPGSACVASTIPVHVTLAVVPGTVPASTSITAVANASAIGGPANANMTPMGVDLSGRWLFDLNTVAAASTPVGQQPIPVAAVDDQGRSASGTLWFSVTVCCPADLDNGSGAGVRDGGVDINDLLFFLARFELGNIAADLDNGGGTGTPDGGVDINDLLFFLIHFESGC